MVSAHPRRRRAIAAPLIASALLAGCGGLTGPGRGPTYTPAELGAICQRDGGWWRLDTLIGGGFCEYQGPQP